MTNHPRPGDPLTCSEVVERLATECSPPIGVGSKVGYFDRAKAEAILHSWRLRRVQELEEALRGAADNLGLAAAYLRDAKCEGWADKILALSKDAENKLANSEWREQIRKGAKHE